MTNLLDRDCRKFTFPAQSCHPAKDVATTGELLRETRRRMPGTRMALIDCYFALCSLPRDGDNVPSADMATVKAAVEQRFLARAKAE